MSFDEKELCEDFFEHIDDLLEFPVDDDLDALVRDDQAVNVAGIESWSSNGGLLFDSPTAADDVIVMNTTTCPAANNFDHGRSRIDQSCSEQQPATDGRHHQNHLQHSQVLSVIPCEDMAELEWLSNFVEDSFSNSPTKEINPIDPFSSANVSSHVITTTITTVAFKESHQFRSSSPVSVLESSSSGGGGETASKNSGMLSCADDNSNQQFISTGNTIPGRARSKRPRPTAAYSPRYHLLPYPTATTSTAIAASSETESSNNVPTISSPDLSASSSCFTAQLEYVHTEYNVPPKKILCKGIGLFGERKRKKAFEHSVSVRKCTHCEIQKTPQWRAGPLGPKTLCNACGVRFKSGRLYPEYRPAASPTFVPSKHSNSHKKVLEMRVRKTPAEEDEEQEEELLLQGNPLMASFTESEYCYY